MKTRRRYHPPRASPFITAAADCAVMQVTAMKRISSALFTSACLALAIGAAGAQSGSTPDRPHFTSESLAAFRTAFAGRTGASLDRVYGDETRYHAFRFVQRGAVTIGIAKRISVDSSGRVHIVGEPGTVTYGRNTTGTEYSHILVPVGVTPP
ncbi:MAG TPA: hypothetical protein VHS78_00785 [Candidatus Elarobacter sp.]|jgi:hypothetical protein|nr:hypothetical protein [Candidatus Elarobacter sp.]